MKKEHKRVLYFSVITLLFMQIQQWVFITDHANITLNILQVSEQTVPQVTKNTKIIAFSDASYKEIASNWYMEMEQLGYREHLVVVFDSITAQYFAENNMRYDFITSVNNTTKNVLSSHATSFTEHCQDHLQKFAKNKTGKIEQTKRRTVFGSRWVYVLQQLQSGHNVLLTDVDNVFVRYVPMSVLEQSMYDTFHAYGGTTNSFPRDIYKYQGFTICGGMSWLRSTPSVIEFVTAITNQCGCSVKYECSCHCDDQVVLNSIVYNSNYSITWDSPVTTTYNKTEISWNGMTGTCNATGHRVKIWNRHVAYRDEFSNMKCPNESKSWITMPSRVKKETIWNDWRKFCNISKGEINATTYNDIFNYKTIVMD